MTAGYDSRALIHYINNYITFSLQKSFHAKYFFVKNKILQRKRNIIIYVV